MTLISEVLPEAELRKNGITCLSISVISDEFRNQERNSECSSGVQRTNNDSSNENITTEEILDSQQRSSEESDNNRPKLIFQVFAAIMLSFINLGMGIINGFPSVSLPQLTQPDSDMYLSSSNAALYASMINIGAICGSISAGPIVSKFGPRYSMLLSFPLTISFWILQAFSYNELMLISARFFLGMMSGALVTPCSTYILEISDKDHRGTLYGCLSTAAHLGYLFLYSLGNSTLSWRYIGIICCAVTTVIPCIGLIFLPESPRWLVVQGKVKEAERSLRFFRGEMYDYRPEINAIISEINLKKKLNGCNQCGQLFQNSWKLLLLFSLFTIICCFNGGLAIHPYLVPIFQSSTTAVDAYTGSALVATMGFIGCVLSLTIIDRIGRKPVHLGSYALLGICNVILGSYFYFQNIEWVAKGLNWVPLLALLVYTFFRGLAHPVLFMIYGEVLPTKSRSLGYSVLTVVFFLGGFIVTLLFPMMIENLGKHGTFWVYSLFCLISVIYSYAIMPETRGLSLEEININMEKDTISNET